MVVYPHDRKLGVCLVPHELLYTGKDRYAHGKQLDGMRGLSQDHQHVDVYARGGHFRVRKLPSFLQQPGKAHHAHDL